MTRPAHPPHARCASLRTRDLLIAAFLLVAGSRLPAASEEASSDISPKLSVHGFADFSAQASQSRTDAGASTDESSFVLGELDLYLVSSLADNISFLSEVVFEVGEDEKPVEIERLVLKYSISDRFWTSIGRHHAALGYWNETFHHGLILQPTVARPEVLKFEDHGGILPIHNVGIAFGGRSFFDRWAIDWEGNLSNGRGLTSEDVQTTSDLDGHKAGTIRLTVSREATSRLLFGPMLDFDTIPADPGVPGREQEIGERIVGAHLAYRDSRLDVISEYYYVLHEVHEPGDDFQHAGWFAIGMWVPWKWKPYVGVDRQRIEPGDPFYPPTTVSVRRVLAGVRWDFHPFNALKIEYRHEWIPGLETDAIVAQCGFMF